MYPLISAAMIFLAVAVQAEPAQPAANPCTNGSFEQLAPGGFPLDWGAVGRTVEVSSDAHSGRRSLRLARSADTSTSETGLNRGWTPGPGRPGALIDRLRGGITFWYKAVSAQGAELNVYVIPVSEAGVEGTGSPRATFTVPEQHIGDGRWHQARLKYDFTDNPKVKWVHYAARIVGSAGELLLDDFSYVDRVGTILRFGKVRLEEDPERPGERCTVRIRVENAGDSVADDVWAAMSVPAGFRALPERVDLGTLKLDDQARATWTLEGSRTGTSSFQLAAGSGDAKAATTFTVAPELSIRSFGPVAPVQTREDGVRLECVLENTGTATVVKPRVEFVAGSAVAKPPAGYTPDEIPPGRSATFSGGWASPSEDLGMAVSVRVAAENTQAELSATSRVIVGSSFEWPGLSQDTRAAVTEESAVIKNQSVQLAFRRSKFGFGPGRLSVARRVRPIGTGREAVVWRTIAWLPRLARLVLLDADGTRREHVVVTDQLPEAADADPARLEFFWKTPEGHRPACRVRVGFTLAGDEKSIAAEYELGCEEPCKLLAFDGPMLYALNRDEAVFPGLEWLTDDEVSSSTLDIAEGHPHQVRYVVHPNMVTIPAVGIHSEHGTVGLVWDVHQKWDGVRDRPSVVFASPDRFENQRSHLVGLFLPSVPEFVEPNRREAAEPYPLAPGKPVRLTARIFADSEATDALAAVDEWYHLHGCPDPAPLPHGSYGREIEFSMQAYLESLWEPETKEWWTTKGSAMMSQTGRPRSFVADLLLGEVLSPSEAIRRACRDRADEVLGLIGGEPRIDAQRFFGRADLAMANPGRAAGLLASRGPDGGWRFDADHVGGGPFVGMDYYDLGPDEALELGTCARKAFDVLRYARIAGDREAYDRMRPTLELMERFRVPRAAQVWEVPVHTPDVLAAADAVDAYLEAYRFSGEERWLRDAVSWARRGLPFIYLWDDPEKPFLVGGSIPVFGATWYRGSWFGCPVQWNGLRYANSLLNLAEHDESYPWRQIAEAVIRSAIRQQDLEGENVALWPDNISAIDSAKCPWVFGPRQIIRNILKLTGRDEDPATVILGEGDRRLHVTATARISEAAWDAAGLSFRLAYPQGEQGVVLVSNVAQPARVLIDGKPVPQRDDVEQGPEPGWRYDAANAYLAIRVPREGESAIRVENAAYRAVRRLPWLAEQIAFEFDDSLEGWTPAHDIARMDVADGVLSGQITGGDPYLVRPLLRVPAETCPVIRLRMRVTAGSGGQLFWTTVASPSFDEDRSLRFAVQPDGRFHDYRLELGKHPLWAGQTITAVRIDPGGGAPAGEFAIDYVRGSRD